MAESKIRNIVSIVESGTSGIWTYRKWSDGTAECWGTSMANTGSYYGSSAVYVSVDLPLTFVGSPVYAPSAWVSGDAYCNVAWSDVTTTHINVYTKCYTQVATGTTAYVRHYVIGQWK